MKMDQNRTIVECKSDIYYPVTDGFMIRIEPQWNVNKISNVYQVDGLLIRIEPQWNVNFS